MVVADGFNNHLGGKGLRPNGVIETFFRRLNNPSASWAEQITKYGK